MMINLQTEQKFSDLHEGKELTFAQLLVLAASQPPEGKRGFTLPEQRERWAILDKLEATELDAEFDLNHDEWSKLVKWVDDFQAPMTKAFRDMARALQAEMDSKLPEDTTEEK